MWIYLGARSPAVVLGFHLDQNPDTLDVALDVSQSTLAEWQPDGPRLPDCLLSNPARAILVCQVPTLVPSTLPGFQAEDEVKGQDEWQPDGPRLLDRLLSNPARAILVCQVPTLVPSTLPGFHAKDEVKGLEMGLVGQGGVVEPEREVGLAGEVAVREVVVAVGTEVDAVESLGWGVTLIWVVGVAVKAAEVAEVFQEVGLTMIAELGYWAIESGRGCRQPAADVLQAVHAAYILQCLSIR